MVCFTSILVAFLVFQCGVLGKEETPTVKTPLGIIEGHIGLTVNSNPFYKFEGVPYAKPPVGDLRFEEPQDVEPWIGKLKANVLTGCIQYDHFKQDIHKNYVVHGDEDCLYVNIYTHTTDSSANLDVLVHIHGGAFMFGRGSNYGPDIIMERNIVFVNLNYRLGPLGFSSTEDEVISGNMGLRDQSKALKFIKENIKYFGGNPDSITIHGLSAGGASVHLHYLSPASKGLFNKGISQSGCALNPWVLVENIKQKTAKVADLVGCPSGNSQQIKQCLKTKSARSIVQTVKEFQPFLYNPYSPFGVVLDGKWAKNPVLPDHPYKLLKQGKVQDLPWIISYTSAEGLYPAADFWADNQHLIDIDTKWNDIILHMLHYNETVNPSLRDKVSQKIREFYLGSKPVNRDTYSKFVEILSDRLFVADLEMAARLQSAVTKSDVYSYLFDYRGAASKSNPRTNSNDNIGVSHGDDTIYILYDPKVNTLSNEEDKNMSKMLLDLSTSFMHYSKPNVAAEWKPLAKSLEEPYRQLKITGPHQLEMELKDEIGHSKFWSSLNFAENAHAYNIEKDEL